MKTGFLCRILFVTILFSLAACQAMPPLPGAEGKVLQSKTQRVKNPDAPSADVQQVVDGGNAFALDLYRTLSAGDANIFYSPYSISTALAMTYAGAAGDTAAQMAQTLHYPLDPARLHPAFNALDLQISAGQKPASKDVQPFQLSVANSLWAQQDFQFRQEYLDLVGMNYGAGLRLLDFKSDPETPRQTINRWVEDQTNQRIKDLLPQGSLDTYTRLVLANAIYFKADWMNPFEASKTNPGPFHKLDGSQVDTPMMVYKHPAGLRYYQADGLQAVELSYVGGTVSMLILVPDSGNFDQVQSTLDAAQLDSVLSGLQDATVNLVLPKFQFAADYRMADTLKAMGMPDAFNVNKADFSGMDGERDLYIGGVFHKAFVAVDEKGTEAAAATGIVMEAASALINPSVVNLVVDRPFIFLIRHNPTGAILFMGRVMDPSS